MVRRKIGLLIVSVLFCLWSFSIFAQRQIAVTIDDPTTAKTPLLNWYERDSLLLRTLDKHKIKVMLFVCGMRVDHSIGKKLLKNWNSKNHLICNHSYSHLYYNSKSNTSDIFISDFKKGDSIIRGYKNYTKLFRFPYLKEGDTAEKRESMRAAMNYEGYQNGHVTIDASDWYINAQLTVALTNDINADLTPYKEYYIKHILDRANYYDSLAHLVFNRDIKHTLLIHHSLLNALFLDDLLHALKANGWKLIDARDSYKDKIFQKQPNIEPCGESIVWQCTKEIDSISNTLRFPAEDGEYEKKPLEIYLKEYRTRINKNRPHIKRV